MMHTCADKSYTMAFGSFETILRTSSKEIRAAIARFRVRGFDRFRVQRYSLPIMETQMEKTMDYKVVYRFRVRTLLPPTLAPWQSRVIISQAESHFTYPVPGCY